MRNHHVLSPWSLFGLFTTVCLFGAHSVAEGAVLKAGSARVDITPQYPVTLTGYASRKGLSQGVHDPLTARVLAFECDGRKLALVLLDNCGFYNDTLAPLREKILSACPLKPEELFMCATHTHAGPSLVLDPTKGHSNNVAYTAMLRDTLAATMQEALNRMTPVKIGFSSGVAPVGVNRREAVTDKSGKKQIILGRNPMAVTDREVQVLKVTPAEKSDPYTVLFAYAAHSTCLGPQNYTISGDVHGLAEQFVEKYLGNKVMAQGFAGASGDIAPWFKGVSAFDTTNGWMPEPVLLGTLLGTEVANTLLKIETSASSGPIQTLFRTLDLPGKPKTETAEPDGSTHPMSLSVARVGDIAFVGLGGEIFNAIGAAIKTNSPFPCTVIMTHCNGAAGYLPTRETYADGGYEIRSSHFAPGAAELVIAEAGRMLMELKNRPR